MKKSNQIAPLPACWVQSKNNINKTNCWPNKTNICILHRSCWNKYRITTDLHVSKPYKLHFSRSCLYRVTFAPTKLKLAIIGADSHHTITIASLIGLELISPCLMYPMYLSPVSPLPLTSLTWPHQQVHSNMALGLGVEPSLCNIVGLELYWQYLMVVWISCIYF